MDFGRALKRLATVPPHLRGVLRFRRFRGRYPDLAAAIDRVRLEKITYLSSRHLTDLAEVTLDIEARNVSGAVLEAGTALGGSAVVLARAKADSRPMFVFDAFGMIPPPTEMDGPDVHERYAQIVSGSSTGIGGEVYYGYRDDLEQEVRQSFRRHGVIPESNAVTFVKGYYENTIPGAVDFPVALAHLDCDWYESVMVCLREIEPHIVPGGRFVIDDYYSWSGCTAAVDEFFKGREDYRWERRSCLHLVKIG